MEFTSLDVSGEGTVGRQNGVTRFTEIVRRLRLTLGPGGNRNRRLWVLEKGQEGRLVTASISTSMRVEPDVTDV